MSVIPRLRVAIIGAGIGGLSSAIALSQVEDIQVDIYEAAPDLKDLGAGIGIGARPWAVLQDLGLEATLKRLTGGAGPQAQIFEYSKADQPQAIVFGDPELLKDSQGRMFHRAGLQRALADHLQACSAERVHIRFNKRLASYSEDMASGQGVSLLFRDGSVESCDVVVGADGINSAVRKHILLRRAMTTDDQAKRKELLDSLDAAWSGSVCYRGLVPREILEAAYPDHPIFKNPFVYCGNKRRVIAYQIMHHGQAYINLVCWCSWPEKEYTTFDGKTMEARTTEELVELFEGWEKSVVDMLSCLNSPLRWAVNVVKPLDSYVYGKAALLGDAAHAMHPTLASGGGSAIEDAYMLATLLSRPSVTPSNVNHALEVYDLVRRPFANLIAARSREQTRLFEFIDERFSHLTVTDPDRAKLHELAVLAGKNMSWAWATGTPIDKETAFQMLEERHVQPSV